LSHQTKLAAMGEMVGNIAHQWRQPLNTLGLNTQFLDEDFEDNLIDKKYIKEFSDENMKLINFMSKTIDDFRNFFRTEKTKNDFSIIKSIENSISILKPQLDNHSISIKVTGDDFITNGIENELQQVILNLINNARDAILDNNIENGQITVDIEKNSSTISIEDNAGGIPEDIIDRIFEPYYTTKEEGKGTGLGLYMSNMIIKETMNGKLSVKNSDNGAKFTISLSAI
jgi:signal transduction histidine kinase